MRKDNDICAPWTCVFWFWFIWLTSTVKQQGAKASTKSTTARSHFSIIPNYFTYKTATNLIGHSHDDFGLKKKNKLHCGSPSQMTPSWKLPIVILAGSAFASARTGNQRDCPGPRPSPCCAVFSSSCLPQCAVEKVKVRRKVLGQISSWQRYLFINLFPFILTTVA